MVKVSPSSKSSQLTTAYTSFLIDYSLPLVKRRKRFNKRLSTREHTIQPHQSEAAEAVREMYRKDQKRRRPANVRPTFIEAPTGSGKTLTIALLPITLEVQKTLIVTPSKTISDQTANALGIADENILVKAKLLRKNELGEFVEGVSIIRKASDITEDLSNTVIITAQQFTGRSKLTLNKKYQNDETEGKGEQFLGRFNLLVIDEAHRYPTRTYKRIVQTFINSGGEYIVGLSATLFKLGPEAEPNPTFDDLENRIAYRVTTSQLEGEHIRKASFVEKVDVMQLSNHIRDILERQRLEEPRFEPQAMIIVKTKNEAVRYEQILNTEIEAGYAVAIVRGLEGINEEKQKSDFDKGNHRVAIVCGLLNEGYDNPKVTLCVILTKIRSLRKFSQFVGRCLRINRDVQREVMDKTKAVVLSYTEFEQKVMWDEREKLAKWDSVEENDDLEDV